ncbi:MAG TPA: hypothetical protein VFJ72_16995 [Rubrobacteraceae bacterium]|nr:hypothetical protein [Rubrobacteraceae bacterium]
MMPAEATAEVFWTAFTALPAETREKVIEKMLADSVLREEVEDLLDLEVVRERSSEPARPLDDVLAELND